MNRKIDLLVKGIKNLIKAIHYVFALVDNKFKRIYSDFLTFSLLK